MPFDKYLIPLKFKQRFRVKVSDTPIMTVVLNEIHVCVDYMYLHIHSLYYRYYYHYYIVLSVSKPLLLFLFHTSIISFKLLSVSSTGDYLFSLNQRGFYHSQYVILKRVFPSQMLCTSTHGSLHCCLPPCSYEKLIYPP